MTSQVNLIGMFRSGTNFARTLLEWNYDVSVEYDAYGWKHTIVPTFSNHSRFAYPEGPLLVIIKNPYSALLSWYKYARKTGRNILGDTRSFSSFLRNTVLFRDDTNKLLSPEYYFSNPVQMWNAIAWNHLSVAHKIDGFVVEYEQLLSNPEETCDKIARKLRLRRKSMEFLVPQNVVRNMNDDLRPNEHSKYQIKKEFDRTYQGNKQYLKEYNDDDLMFVTRSLNADVVRRAGIGTDSIQRYDSSAQPALYTVSGDTRLLSLSCLLESNNAHDRLPVRLIPFDDNDSLTEELAEIYGACFVSPDPKWDRLGKSIFGDEEYRPGAPSWRYFRKLNVFDGSPRHVVYTDSNVVLLNSLTHALDALSTHDLVFGERSYPGRNFPPWATDVLNVLEPNLKDGFNASFWATRSDLLIDLDIEAFFRRPKLRVMLGKAPEQSFMQLVAVLLRKRIGALGEIKDDIRPTLWGDASPPKEISYALKHNVTRNGRIPLAIKWSGNAFHRKHAMKSAHVYQSLFEDIAARVRGSRALSEALQNQFQLAVKS